MSTETKQRLSSKTSKIVWVSSERYLYLKNAIFLLAHKPNSIQYLEQRNLLLTFVYDFRKIHKIAR